MEQLFAPWRIEWVRRREPDDDIECIFCHFWEREADREHLVVARGEHAYVMLNNYPYNPGHLMVVPVSHTGHFADLSSRYVTAIGMMTQHALRALESSYHPDGFNVGYNLGGAAAGGSIIDHVHQHIVPRWSGDTNFMPILDETKVIVEGIDATYDQLHEAFAALPGGEVIDGDTAIELR